MYALMRKPANPVASKKGAGDKLPYNILRVALRGGSFFRHTAAAALSYCPAFYIRAFFVIAGAILQYTFQEN